MGWLAGARTEAATDRILEAVGELFADHGDAGVSMDGIAKRAGCSRATLYRYFDSRHAVLTAYAHREARRIVQQVTNEVRGFKDPVEQTTESVLRCLAIVRSRGDLRRWYEDGRLLSEILRESPLIESWAAGVGRGGAPDVQLGRWVLRAVLSLLTMPGEDDDEERAMVRRFLTPHLLAD
jgi:AcrR family transcriptional regulator